MARRRFQSLEVILVILINVAVFVYEQSLTPLARARPFDHVRRLGAGA
jgi:hypothetical protein